MILTFVPSTMGISRRSTLTILLFPKKNAPLVSEVLGDAILNLNAAGIPLKNITITGHSLGGQIAGLTSAYIKSKSPSSVRIGKIFGE